MGVKWTADVRITFELKEGQPEGLARTVLTRELYRLRDALEQGGGIFVLETGVRRGSADIEILWQGPLEEANPVPAQSDHM
jgi:hypothetical protein